ncbi:zeta toxin family protein, partial [Enterococcus faecium]|uniref:zeta toxin family protein n=1 Tax=Enterococcus faecium TaxID=1352 RepID=UPI003D0F58C9
MANITDFTEKQFEDRLEKNVERLTKNRLAVESPTAFLLGGQPGSGKTSLRSAIFGSIIYGTDESELILQPHF